MARSQSAAPSAALIGRIDRAARQAVDEAAAVVAGSHRPRPRDDVRRKGPGDLVTSVDLRSERRLRTRLLEIFPEHGFLGEEGEPLRPDAPFVWVVDPIDGTSNFARGLPTCGIAAACLFRGRPLAGAVHVLPEGVTYSAARGRGARRGTRRLHTPRARLDDSALLGVQWFRGSFESDWLGPLLRCGARIRVLGSTVVQLCDVAAGRLHGNVQAQGMPWDIAAAAYVAQEAGCRATDWEGRPLFPLRDLTAPGHHPSVVAPAGVHRRLLELLRGR